MLERGGEDVAEEIARLVAALVGDDLGVEHERERVVVAGRVAVRDHAADGPEVAHLVVADVVGHLHEDRQGLAQRRVALDVDVTHQRTDLHGAVVAADLA